MATREELIASAPEYIWADQVMGIWLDRDQPDRRSPLVKYRRADAALPQGEDVDGELVEQLRHAAFTEPEPNRSALHSKAADLIEAQAAQIARYEKRLEIDHHYAMGEGDELVRQETPPSEREAQMDGIECRDATIKELEAQIASLSAKVAEVKRERDEARLLAQTIGDQLGKDIDRLTRSLASAEARASKLQREVERLERERGELKYFEDFVKRNVNSDLTDAEIVGIIRHYPGFVARAALQQEGK